MTKFNQGRVRSFDVEEEMQQALANDIAADLAEALSEKAMATLVVSGGSTPKRLFQILSEADLPWQNVTITLADDRWLNPDDKDSNERLVFENLLQNNAKKAKFIGLKSPDDDAFQGEKTTDERLKSLPLPYDVTVLGMGMDGHTASLFPCASQLQLAVDCEESRCRAVLPESAPYQRMTQTLNTLRASEKIYLQLNGQEKMDVYRRASSEGAPEEMPIRYFMSDENKPLNVYWAR